MRLGKIVLVSLAACLVLAGCQQEVAAETQPQEAKAHLDPEKQAVMDEQLKGWDPSKDK